MSTTIFTIAAPARGGSAALIRAMLILVVGAALLAGRLTTPADVSAQAVAAAGADLTRLLRGMAAIKLLMAAAMTAAIFWRLAVSVSIPRFTSYAVACAAMAAGPGLIWDMEYVRTGALLLHGGLLAAILLFWRDRAVGARLSAFLAARRAAH